MRTPTLYVIAAAVLTLAACGSDSPVFDCKAPAACSATPTIDTTGGVACGTYGANCPDQSTTCNQPVVNASGIQEVVIPGGPFTVGQTVTFQVPPGTASISIIEQITNPGQAADYVILGTSQISNVAVPDQVKAPGGVLIYSDITNGSDPEKDTAFFASDSPGTGVFTIPNTSAGLARLGGGVPAGTWQFLVNDYAYECPSFQGCSLPSPTPAPGKYDVRVLLRSGSLSGNGTVDVGVYFVGVPTPLTVANAASDAGFKRMVDTLSKLYGAAGICIGKVTVYDVPTWAHNAYGTINLDNTGPCSPLDQMFTLSMPGNQLNFFLVNGFTTSTSSGGGTIVGIDGTIPGPSAYAGTIHSGAAVNGSNLEARLTGCVGSPSFSGCGPDEVAYITAHEGGHWLGLYHTTELHGDNFDTLEDTAKCPCSSCAPTTSTTGDDRAHCTASGSAQTVVSNSMCVASNTCGGGENLMFWQLAGESTGALSCEQGAVMRANPAIH